MRSKNSSIIKDNKSLDYSVYLRLKNNYDLQSNAFNAGFIVFETDIISNNVYDELIALANSYNKVLLCDDQSVLNLLFYKRWKPLPLAYNSNPYDLMTRLIYSPTKARAIVLHFMGSDKPWRKFNFWHKEWETNLKKADKIDLKNIPKPKEEWSKYQLLKNDHEIYSKYDKLYFVRLWWFIIFKIRKKLEDIIIKLSFK